jgi:hypothetical protein
MARQLGGGANAIGNAEPSPFSFCLLFSHKEFSLSFFVSSLLVDPADQSLPASSSNQAIRKFEIPVAFAPSYTLQVGSTKETPRRSHLLSPANSTQPKAARHRG